MFYGLIGVIFYTVISTISTFSKIESPYIWFINEDNSFIGYFNTFNNIKDIIFEALDIIIGMFTSYFIKYYFMLIIKYLTPVHIIFLSPIFYFFFKLVLIIYNVFYCTIKKDFSGFFNTKDMSFLVQKFFLDVSGDVVSFIGFLIYLEIIELNCFQLDYNLRNTITRRGINESLDIENINDEDDMNDSFIEENENNENNIKNNTELFKSLENLSHKE